MKEEDHILLKIEQIHTYYGLSHVLFGISLEVKENEIVCLLGRNGAGKSTTIRSIAGLTPPKSGNIYFYRENITTLHAHLIARKGIRSAFSDKRAFGDLTVWENLEIFKRRPLVEEKVIPWDKSRIYGVFPVLKAFEKRLAKTLSGGEQQMLCLACALMGNPKLLLLDEPTIGLSPLIVNTMIDQILKIKNEGLSILLAEQNVKFGNRVGDRCYIIDVGEIRYNGNFDELLGNEYVMRTYLSV